MGSFLGDEVVHVLRGIQKTAPGGEIRTMSTRLELPGRYAESRVEYLDVYAARIGDIGFLGVNCEVLTEAGQAIKAESPFKQTFVITICNGGEGYLPPKRLYKEGGYEVGLTTFAPEAADLLVKHAAKMLGDLRK